MRSLKRRDCHDDGSCDSENQTTSSVISRILFSRSFSVIIGRIIVNDNVLYELLPRWRLPPATRQRISRRNVSISPVVDDLFRLGLRKSMYTYYVRSIDAMIIGTWWWSDYVSKRRRRCCPRLVRRR